MIVKAARLAEILRYLERREIDPLELAKLHHQAIVALCGRVAELTEQVGKLEDGAAVPTAKNPAEG